MILPVSYAPAYDCGMNDKYAIWLKNMMAKLNITQYRLSQLSGVPQPTISRIIKSKTTNPKAETLDALAHVFEIIENYEIGEGDEVYAQGMDPHSAPNPSWLESAKKENDQADELEFVGRLDVWDSNTPLDDDEVELPLFREVELAAGAGQTQVIENHGAKLRFAKSTLSRAGVQKEHAACAFVRGNSMEPVMPDGTCVGVDTGDTTVRDGEIYAIEHGGMLRVKYLHRRPGGGIKIVSQNSIEHEAEDYTATRVVEENIRVIGRVFWWSVLR